MSPECTYWVAYQVRGLYLEGAKWFWQQRVIFKGIFSPRKPYKVSFLLLGFKVGLSPHNGGQLMRTRPFCKQTFFSFFFSGKWRALFVSVSNRVDCFSFFPSNCDILMCVIIKLIQIWACMHSESIKGCRKHNRRHFTFQECSFHQHIWYITSPNVRVSYKLLADGFNMHRFLHKVAQSA